jgi:ribosomal subunit interface protein
MRFATIKATNILLTPALKIYIEEKLGALERFVKRWEKESDIKIHVEVGRTTRHHHKGDVFRAEANILLPGTMLRAEDEDFDIHVAIDRVRDRLKREIRKYRTLELKRNRTVRKK